jgi:hypothetical protein
MGKSGDKATKSAVKLRMGGMVKKMAKGGAVKKSPRPRSRPDDLMEGQAVHRGNRAIERERREEEGLMPKRRMRMGGMVKK